MALFKTFPIKRNSWPNPTHIRHIFDSFARSTAILMPIRLLRNWIRQWAIQSNNNNKKRTRQLSFKKKPEIYWIIFWIDLTAYMLCSSSCSCTPVHLTLNAHKIATHTFGLLAFATNGYGQTILLQINCSRPENLLLASISKNYTVNLCWRDKIPPFFWQLPHCEKGMVNEKLNANDNDDNNEKNGREATWEMTKTKNAHKCQPGSLGPRSRDTVQKAH